MKPIRTIWKTSVLAFSVTALATGLDFPLYWAGPQGEGFKAAGGDVNGDGRADLILVSAALFASPTSPQQAFVRSGLNGSLVHTWSPSLPTTWAFEANSDLKAAGDLNLDGFGDVALSIMAPNTFPIASTVEVRSGVDGSVMALIPTPTVSNALVFGSAIAGVGDLDGDGLPELLVRGDFWFPGCALGHGVYDVEAPGFVLQSYQTTWQCAQEFGNKIGRLDDVDGDGSPDYYVSAPGTDVGLALEAGWIGVFSSASGSLVSSLSGTSTFEFVGTSVAALSDVTGDGSPELALYRGGALNQLAVVSLPSFSTVYVLTPGAAVDAVGDADGDGFDDLLISRWTPASGGQITVLSGPTGAPIGGLTQNAPGGTLLPFGGVGDVNGDGLGDFVATPGVTVATVPSIAAQGLWSPWFWPMGNGVATVYVAPNLGVAVAPTVGGTAQFQVVAPRLAGRPFQVVFSQDYAWPAIPAGPFLFPLVPDALFWASLAAGIGGTLNSGGLGTLTVPIPNNPALHGAWFSASGFVYDPAGPLGIGCVLTQAGFQIP